MRIYTYHPVSDPAHAPRGCDAWSGPGIDALILPATSSGEPWGAAREDNPLGERSPGPPGEVPGGRLVVYSGWLDGPDRATGGVFASGFRTWAGAGLEAFERWCDGVEPDAARLGLRILVRPHARHVLSDAQSCLTWLRRREGGPFGLLLDPAALLTPAMLARADVHIERTADALATHPDTAGALVTGLEPAPGNPEELRAARIGEGVLDPALMAPVVERSSSVVLLAGRVPEQASALGLPGFDTA